VSVAGDGDPKGGPIPHRGGRRYLVGRSVDRRDGVRAIIRHIGVDARRRGDRRRNDADSQRFLDCDELLWRIWSPGTPPPTKGRGRPNSINRMAPERQIHVVHRERAGWCWGCGNISDSPGSAARSMGTPLGRSVRSLRHHQRPIIGKLCDSRLVDVQGLCDHFRRRMGQPIRQRNVRVVGTPEHF
jgi:hypothetical protein